MKNLRRNDAILLLARILNSCRPTDVTFISLKKSNPKTDYASEGYELHFKCAIDNNAFEIMNGIIESNDFVFKDYDGLFIIYTPKRSVDNIIIA